LPFNGAGSVTGLWIVLQEFYTKIYEQNCDSYEEEDTSGKPTGAAGKDKKSDDIDHVWAQTSDLHIALLVCYHRVSLRLAGSSIIGKEWLITSKVYSGRTRILQRGTSLASVN